MRFTMGLLFVINAALLQGQVASTTGQPGKQAFILPNLLDQAVSAAPSGLQPVLRDAIQPRWVSLNASVATELSNLPNPTPASAIQYVWDRDSGTFQGTPQSFGPIISERAETVGKGKFLLGITNQNFSFDHLDKLDLRGFEVAYPLTIPLNSLIPGSTSGLTVQGLIVADAYINVHLNETTAHFTYGLTHWLDASYAFSIVSSSTTVRGGAVLRLPATGQSLTSLPTQNVQLSSTGLGDGILRLKANLSSHPSRTKMDGKPSEPQSRKIKFALGADFRLPFGDEFNYHGAGAYGVKPFVVVSMNNRVLSPHLNVGFLWNGKSYLASQYPTETRHLPGQLDYAIGFDAAMSRKVTVAVDFLDQMVISGQRTLLQPFTSTDGVSYSQISFEDRTHQEYSGSAGLKVQPKPHFVITANALFRLNDSGLRARIVPLVGMSYQFP